MNAPTSQPKFYNTLTQRTEAFEPKQPGEARVYVCGPTVYDVPHAGHARSAVAFDILIRHLRARSLKAVLVRNITDIDDKILNRARETGEDPLSLSARMTQVYVDDMTEIGCLQPDHQPKVSEHIPEIIELVQRLIELDSAYVAEMPNGTRDVYFAVRSFKDYGKLSHRKIDDLEVGARVGASEVKRDPLDFALWKGALDEAYGWDSPWGRGRPGWHIECSAMSSKYLGHGFDIHGGGMDLIFPHHENEIAQSEAAHPNDGCFAHTWMHNGFVNVDKEKMSKSLGNFVTVRDVLQRNDPEAFRYFLLTVQYRGPLTFDTDKLESGRVIFPRVDEAERRTDYLFTTVGRLDAIANPETPAPKKWPTELVPIHKIVAGARQRVTDALDDDLNTPVALAVLGELATTSNDLCDLATKRKKDTALQEAAAHLATNARQALHECAGVLGLLQTSVAEYETRTKNQRLALRGLRDEDIDRRVEERGQARVLKDFARADEIRKELLGLGVEIADTPAGTVWRIGV